jgi:hypothetical protein
MLAVDIEKIPFYKDGLEKFKLSIDDIVKELNIKKEELLEYINKK